MIISLSFEIFILIFILRFCVEVFTLFSLTLSSQKPSPSPKPVPKPSPPPSVSHIQCQKEKEDLLCEIEKRKKSEEQLQQEITQMRQIIDQLKKSEQTLQQTVQTLTQEKTQIQEKFDNFKKLHPNPSCSPSPSPSPLPSPLPSPVITLDSFYKDLSSPSVVESIGETGYVPTYLLVKGYTPPNTCAHHMLNDMKEVMPIETMEHMQMIVDQSKEISQNRLQHLPAHVPRLHPNLVCVCVLIV